MITLEGLKDYIDVLLLGERTRLKKKLEAIIEHRTEKELGTTDYDGVAEDVLELIKEL